MFAAVWIKKNYRLAAAAVLSACMLFGCTRADGTTSSGNTGDSSQNAAQSALSIGSSQDGNTLAGAGAQTGGGNNGTSAAQQSAQTTATAAPASSAVSAGDQANAQAAQNVSGMTTQTASSNSASTQNAGSCHGAFSLPGVPLPTQ